MELYIKLRSVGGALYIHTSHSTIATRTKTDFVTVASVFTELAVYLFVCVWDGVCVIVCV